MGYSLNQRGLFEGVVRAPGDRTVKTNEGEFPFSFYYFTFFWHLSFLLHSSTHLRLFHVWVVFSLFFVISILGTRAV